MPILTALMPIISSIFSLIPNPVERAQKLQELVTALQQWDSQQSDVNKVEAANSNLFVSGWRPSIGWVCALATAYQYLGVPIISWYFIARGLPVPLLPKLDDNLWQLTFGMLGMSGLRTFEKMQGKTK